MVSVPFKVRLEARLPFLLHPTPSSIVDPLLKQRLPLVERDRIDTEARPVVSNADSFEGDVLALNVEDTEMISSRICVVDVEFHELVSPDLLAQREKPLPLSAPRVRSELSQLTIDRVQRAAGLEPGRTELEQIIERCDL